MAFFKELSERIGDYTLTLTITRDKGQLVVMLVPKLEAKKDDALKEIIPLTVKGTPDQLDAGFILAISQGIQMTTGLQTNIKEFEASLKKAEKKVKGKDDKKSDSPSLKETNPKLASEEDPEDDDDNQDENTAGSGEDEMTFGDKVDQATGEIKEEKSEKKEPAKTAEPKKPVEPKAKEAKPKEEKTPAPASTALTGEPIITKDDEWD